MTTLPLCLKCQSEYVYQEDQLLICPECSYEWQADETSSNELVIRDSNGNSLADGDSVAIIKDLKLKGSSQVIKVGTKIKNIRLVTGDHDIDCKIDGFGAIKLKSQFVKKV
ncbi:zinc ribbon domain-containing protein YjdM [Francisella hispaniensis]|uniref:zinc ribbon domain-containing protein YjdM n=1 Tax=Francisella hispaniensis TaxID=622488 RepID=UPI0005C713F0|nr:zinc ribbon domain-containing protein YjdM [Francisella hispaniensis]MBK2356809.1 alkylphosphonate utilization protein [Francisella hispaniensis]